MSVTLRPAFEALGYTDPVQQRALIKLLQASGAFGEVQGVNGTLTDNQAQAILDKVTYFEDPQAAARWLHDATQKHFRRPDGTERYQCIETENYQNNRDALL